MEKQIRCKKCGRRLKSPISIAIGMGPKCAGIPSRGKSVPSGVARSAGKAYAVTTFDHVQPALFSGDLPTKHLSKREMARRRKEERRRLFETREPFQCGMVLPKKRPLIYVPLADGMWRETPSGRVISHEHLQKYLTRYKII
jgi:hypothetical protein